MRQFAEIMADTTVIRCVIAWPFDDVDPEGDPTILQYVEVTGIDPAPQAGWLYTDGTFTEIAPEQEA